MAGTISPPKWRFRGTLIRMNVRAGIAVALLGLMATFSFVAPAQARADEMTIEQAGRAYLDGVCVGNDARDVFVNRVWGDRNNIRIAEVRARLPQLKRLSAAYGRALFKSARLLYNPRAGEWPEVVDGDVRKIANSQSNEAAWRQRQGSAANAEAWLRFNLRANKVPAQAGAVNRVRAMLNLPPPGEGC